MASLRHAGAPRRISLLLIDDFALMSYAAFLEPFRAANSLAGKALYAWTHVAVAGDSATASNGSTLLCERRVGDDEAPDMLFVFAGGDPATFQDRATFAWLRRMAGRGVALGGVSGGPFVLARAGLLDGRRATIHWEHAEAFREAFPGVALESRLYVLDRGRMTCAGGTSGLDLALELIETDHGRGLADRVGEWFIRSEPRRSEGAQRPGLRERYGVRHEGALRALEAMEAQIEAPLGREALAEIAGLSVRQLERLFRAHLGSTIAEVYLRLRLEHARRLLRTTGLSITEVAVACGFQSGSHFARVFRQAFGCSPRAALRQAG
jgi:transcriptional regulator GlxA family with amidase domain